MLHLLSPLSLAGIQIKVGDRQLQPLILAPRAAQQPGSHRTSLLLNTRSRTAACKQQAADAECLQPNILARQTDHTAVPSPSCRQVATYVRLPMPVRPRSQDRVHGRDSLE